MRTVPLMLGLACLLSASSCTRYQYYSFQSSAPLEEKQGFLHKNTDDSIRVTFHWQGGSAIFVDVHNAGKETATIDWSRSALIVNGVKRDVFHKANTTESQGQSLEVSYNSVGISNAWYDAQGISYVTQSQGAVLPNSSSKYVLPAFGLEFFKATDKDPFIPVKFIRTGQTEPTTVRLKKFEKANSPYVVRVFLTYRFGQGEERTIDREFWASEVIDTYRRDMHKIITTDEKAPPIDRRDFNKAGVKRSTGFTQTIAGTALLGLITWGVIASGSNSDK